MYEIIFLLLLVLLFTASCEESHPTPFNDYEPEVEIYLPEKMTTFKPGDVVHLEIYFKDPDTWGRPAEYVYTGSSTHVTSAEGGISMFELSISDQSGNDTHISGLFGFQKKYINSFRMDLELNTSNYTFESDTSKLLITIKASDDEHNIISGTGDLLRLIHNHIHIIYNRYWLQWDYRGCGLVNTQR